MLGYNIRSTNHTHFLRTTFSFWYQGLISRSFVVFVMFREFIWFLNQEQQNVTVRRASAWSAHTCCAPPTALCLKRQKRTFYPTCCFAVQFSSRVVIARSICSSSVRCSLSSSSPDGCCCQVIDHPGSEEQVSITPLPLSPSFSLSPLPLSLLLCLSLTASLFLSSFLLRHHVLHVFLLSTCRSEALHSGSITTGT